eukprot:TRINITY_DN39664_c4_g1_i1.p1 TRINITY_DN39664_c4_g1~~TRINITY_DN39664_c4_g1_i1.p1  ORF type:complete len:124 (+),score=43.98 TRINITY_DN39664_c4_g1_i1:50-421(+)
MSSSYMQFSKGTICLDPSYLLDVPEERELVVYELWIDEDEVVDYEEEQIKSSKTLSAQLEGAGPTAAILQVKKKADPVNDDGEDEDAPSKINTAKIQPQYVNPVELDVTSIDIGKQWFAAYGF